MEELKRIKDPVYGYIQIDTKIMDMVVDSFVFQRLRRVIQTSYAPLYASAVHNRFVHSLGVYHLGRMVVERLNETVNRDVIDATINNDKWKSFINVFLLACLLHDVGHAPFSHTGESFYLGDNKKDYGRLHELLSEYVDNALFSDDINNILPGDEAKPHEIVSAIVGIKEFACLFSDDEERAFFARCITGYKYRERVGEKNIFNCLIEMLNSQVIDVDKLDYLIRDAYITGFDTVKIDYKRLLGAVTIVKNDDGLSYVLAYDKSAISVIENVIFAHDAESHWIQTHPVVTYEAYLLETVVEEINSFFGDSEHPLFSLESLSESGNDLVHCERNDDGTVTEKTWNIRLLSDDDIVYFMKNVIRSTASHEYLCRQYRRHALWKSEAEYHAYVNKKFGTQSTMVKDIENALLSISAFVKNTTHKSTIDEEALRIIEDEYEKVRTSSFAGISEEQKLEKIKDYEHYLKWLKGLREFCEEEKIPFDLLILSVKQFNSSFLKTGYENAIIYMKDHPKRILRIGEIGPLLSSERSFGKQFFYVYYKRNGDSKPSIQKLIQKIGHIAMDE